MVNRTMQRNEVAFVLAFCRHIGLEIRRFADVGAGTGWWAKEFMRQYVASPTIETFDASPAACEIYGHRNVPLEKLGGAASDLVVCRDVLRYVPDAHIDDAMSRLTRKCRGVLYLHLITRDDDIDEEMSDMAGHFRTAAFYRRHLNNAGFRECGMGLFVSPRMKQFDPFALEAREVRIAGRAPSPGSSRNTHRKRS